MASTPDPKSPTKPKKSEKSFWSNPIAYVVVIVIAILIIVAIIYFCHVFFPTTRKLSSVFYEKGSSALKEFSAGTVDCV
jgi:hypothetical protein